MFVSVEASYLFLTPVWGHVSVKNCLCPISVSVCVRRTKRSLTIAPQAHTPTICRHAQHKGEHCNTQCVAVCCTELQCVAVCCSVLQCVAVCCSVLQCVAVCCSVLQCVAVYFSVLQCVALCRVRCSVLQCIASFLPRFRREGGLTSFFSPYLPLSHTLPLHTQSIPLPNVVCPSALFPLLVKFDVTVERQMESAREKERNF